MRRDASDPGRFTNSAFVNYVAKTDRYGQWTHDGDHILFYSFQILGEEFLVRDDEPLLFHTGMNALFPDILEAVATVIDPATLRWVGFSHVEADECGSLNRWLEVAPNAAPVCSLAPIVCALWQSRHRPEVWPSTWDAGGRAHRAAPGAAIRHGIRRLA